MRQDLIFDFASRQFLPAERFAAIEPYLPPKSTEDVIQEAIIGLLSFGVLVVVGVGAVRLFESIFDHPPSHKRTRRAPNREPLESWKKAYVAVRDNYTCTYCGCRDRYGHVDHKTSRTNGGSNLLRNLAWACPPCNLSKGKMNALQFVRLMNR